VIQITKACIQRGHDKKRVLLWMRSNTWIKVFHQNQFRSVSRYCFIDFKMKNKAIQNLLHIATRKTNSWLPAELLREGGEQNKKSHV